MTRPPCTVSMDLDNLWSYQQTHGDPDWVHRRTYLPRLVPQLLDELARLGSTITVFVVGVDTAREENLGPLKAIADAGHEIGSHSDRHEIWLHRYTREQMTEELSRAEAAISAFAGHRPVGFRGPGFSWSPLLLEALAERGYLYDASLLPTFLGPLARAYFMRSTRLSAEERERRKILFGPWRNGLLPVRPFHWTLPNEQRLLEIPVTTIPGIKLPFHLSYLMYLSRFSLALMRGYFVAALRACRALKVAPSFLLHPLDLLGAEEVPELRFFPGMDLSGSHKRRIFGEVLSTLAREFEIMPLAAHARALQVRPGLVLSPTLAV